MSAGATSIALAVLLSVWEFFYLFVRTSATSNINSCGDAGLVLAWITCSYLCLQLMTVPFSVASSKGRFVAACDAMASIMPLLVVLTAIVGRWHVLQTAQKWSEAMLLICVCVADIVGSYIFALALSKRTVDFIRN